MITLELNRDDAESLYYACAQAEIMWRKRSQNPSIDSLANYADTPEEFEAECRTEMKKYRTLQNNIEMQFPGNFWGYEAE